MSSSPSSSTSSSCHDPNRHFSHATGSVLSPSHMSHGRGRWHNIPSIIREAFMELIDQEGTRKASETVEKSLENDSKRPSEGISTPDLTPSKGYKDTVKHSQRGYQYEQHDTAGGMALEEIQHSLERQMTQIQHQIQTVHEEAQAKVGRTELREYLEQPSSWRKSMSAAIPRTTTPTPTADVAPRNEREKSTKNRKDHVRSTEQQGRTKVPQAEMETPTPDSVGGQPSPSPPEAEDDENSVNRPSGQALLVGRQLQDMWERVYKVERKLNARLEALEPKLNSVRAHQDKLQDDFAKFHEEVEGRVSVKDLANKLKQVEQRFQRKLDTGMRQQLNSQTEEVDKKIKEISSSLNTQQISKRELDERAKVEDVKCWLNGKADISYVENSLSGKVDSEALRSLRKDMMDQIKALKTRLRKEIQGTSSSDLEKRLGQVEQENKSLKKKLASTESQQHDAPQQGYSFVRWLWKSRDLTNSGVIPWEIQVPTTSGQPVQWNQGDPRITVLKSGLYECRLGVFVPGFVKVHIQVNDETAISFQPQESQKINAHPMGNVAGHSWQHFLALGEAATLSVRLNSSERGQAFLELRKL
eukprot:gb/GECG01010643.1/.p1 GENE.gb/GECG01010643.1/~~gb/GECG01010643.1/.p1  ORF type:complete len:586 (+),score=89.20 gb/GECG01010643.1/:1-1758(+)